MNRESSRKGLPAAYRHCAVVAALARVCRCLGGAACMDVPVPAAYPIANALQPIAGRRRASDAGQRACPAAIALPGAYRSASRRRGEGARQLSVSPRPEPWTTRLNCFTPDPAVAGFAAVTPDEYVPRRTA